jgi:hypothetical protein
MLFDKKNCIGKFQLNICIWLCARPLLSQSLACCGFLLMRHSLVFPIPTTVCTTVRKSKPSKPRRLNRGKGDKIFRERLNAVAQCCSSSSSPAYFLFDDLLLYHRPLWIWQPRQHHGWPQQWSWCDDLPDRNVRAHPLLHCTSSCFMCRSVRCTQSYSCG